MCYECFSLLNYNQIILFRAYFLAPLRHWAILSLYVRETCKICELMAIVFKWLGYRECVFIEKCWDTQIWIREFVGWNDFSFQVLDVLCSLCVCHGVAVRSNQHLICDNLLPGRDLLLQTRLVNHVSR